MHAMEAVPTRQLCPQSRQPANYHYMCTTLYRSSSSVRPHLRPRVSAPIQMCRASARNGMMKRHHSFSLILEPWLVRAWLEGLVFPQTERSDIPPRLALKCSSSATSWPVHSCGQDIAPVKPPSEQWGSPIGDRKSRAKRLNPRR